jgi:flagellar hook-associated protein 3 FlgL
MANTLSSNLASATERVYKKEQEVLSGKILTKPSDNPVDASNSLQYRSRLNDTLQYKRNITQSQSNLQLTNTALGEISDILDKVNAAATSASAGINSSTEQASLIQQLNEFLDELVSVSNTEANGSFILGGTRNNTPPYEAVRDAAGEVVEVKTTGSSGDINSKVGENIYVKSNINGEDIFEKDQNLFSVVVKIREDIRTDNSEGLRGDIMQVSSFSENLITTQALVGTRLNRLTAAESRADKDTLNYQNYISNIEDADPSKAILDYQTELQALQSSQQASARLLNQSLLDFLT